MRLTVRGMIVTRISSGVVIQVAVLWVSRFALNVDPQLSVFGHESRRFSGWLLLLWYLALYALRMQRVRQARFCTVVPCERSKLGRSAGGPEGGC